MADQSKTGLLDSDDSDKEFSENQPRLVINKKFAKDFEQRKQKQELRNAKEEGLLSSDDDESSEDEDGDLLTTQLDTDIMKTLNALRSKTKEIYDPDAQFFYNTRIEEDDDENDGNNGKTTTKKKKTDKRKRYKDVVREQILEDMEQDGDVSAEDAEDSDTQESPQRSRLVYDKEQQEIRQAFLQSASGNQLESNDIDDDEDEEEFMVVKQRIKGDTADADDKQFQKEVAKMEQSLKDSKETSTIVDPKGEVKDGDKFLLDFFKNRNWIDKTVDGDSEDDNEDDNDEEVPMKQQQQIQRSGDSDDDSLDQLEKNDDFEARYNFRFEAAQAAGSESGADFSNVSYARGQTMTTMRRQDDTRKQKRKARKERKEAERRAKEEQLKRLKNAKRQDMEKKLKEIKKVLGEVEDAKGELADSSSSGIDEAAILKMMEGDYDPETLEKQMEEAFGDDFYKREDAVWKTDQDVRNDLEKDEDGAMIVGDEGQGNLYDDEDENEQAFDNDEEEEEPWVEEDETFGDGEYEEDAKPESELEKKIKSKMQDELYKMDYEDIVAGMPTRFKYRQVEPNNYGLSTEEILFARDSSLRQYVSLKKMAPYREDGEYAVGRKKRRMFREQVQHDLEENETKAAASSQSQTANDSVAKPDVEPTDETTKKKKRRRSKKSKKTNESDVKKEGDLATSEATAPVDKKESAAVPNPSESNEEPPKKKRKRRRKKSNNSSEANEETETPNADSNNPPDDSPVESNKALDEKPPTAQTPTDTTKSEGGKLRAKKPSKKKKKDKKDKKKQEHIGGISASRFASYGLK